MHPNRRPFAPSRSSHPMAWVLFAVLSATAWRCVANTHARRRLYRPKALPEPLQVWEDEGGQSQMPPLAADRPPAAVEVNRSPSAQASH
jgi:hypothetical protein